MSFKGEKLAIAVFSSALALGATACGDKDERVYSTTEREHIVDDLSVQLEVAKVALRDGQTDYEEYFESLPADCQTAVTPFLRPDGELAGQLYQSEIIQIISPWCGTENKDAVVTLNSQYANLLRDEEKVAGLNWWIEANKAALIGLEEL